MEPVGVITLVQYNEERGDLSNYKEQSKGKGNQVSLVLKITENQIIMSFLERRLG